MATKKAAAAADTHAQTTDSTALAKPAGDALGHLDIDFEGEDGLSEVDRDDIKIAVRILNKPGVGSDGEKIPQNHFFDTLDETTAASLNAVFLELHKTNLYSYYDQAADKTEVVCRSFDRVTGTMSDGTQRPCKGCPDAQWRTEEKDGKKKRAVNCGPVYAFFAFDRERQSVFVIRFRRTSLDIAKGYLQKHFIGRRKLANGKMVNYPLYAYETNVTSRWSDNGKYALPVLQIGPQLEDAELVTMMEARQTIRDNMLAIISKADTVDSDASDGDASFNTAELDAQNAAAAAGSGRKFVDEA